MKFKEYSTATDTYTTLPMEFQTSGADVENYQVFGASSGVGEETENLVDISPFVRPTGTTTTKTLKTITLNAGTYTFCLYQDDELTSVIRNTLVITWASGNVYENTNTNYHLNAGWHYLTITLDSQQEVTISYWGHTLSNACSFSKAMLVSGSTAPASYVPPGYKIPILCQSKNLFTETGSGLIQVTGNGAMRYGKSLGKLPAGDYDLSYVRSGQINLFVTFKENGDTYRVSENNPTAFTVLSTDDEVIIRTGYASDDKTWAELGFTNIVVDQQSNYDLFIGDTKLYEDEYVDFSEQKMYKRTENLFDYTAQDTNNGFEANKYINRAGGVNDSSNHNISEYIEIEPNTVYSLCQPRAQLAVSMCFYDSEKSIISAAVEEDAITTVTSPASAKYVRVTIYIQYPSEIMFIPGSTPPETYIPYLQPTDPPLPFPTISTYVGENNISVDTTVQPEKVALTVAAWREIEAKKYVNGSWTDIVVRRYENGAWVPSPIPENNIADLQGLLTLLEDHWLPGVNDYRSMILVRTNRNDDTANQLCYMLTCYSTNPSPHFASEFLNNRYWLNDYAVPYSSTNFYLRKFSWTQGGGWVYDGDEENKRDDYFVPIDSNTYNVYLLRLGSSTQYDNNAGYQYFYDLSAYF